MQIIDWGAVGEFVNQVGFPTFVAVFVLIRIEPIIRSNTEAINQLAVVISNLEQVDGNELSDNLEGEE